MSRFVMLQFFVLISSKLIVSQTHECLNFAPRLEGSGFTTLTHILPDMENSRKGDAGRIGIVGGSIEYTGGPFFAAMSAIRVGADLVYVITTAEAAPVIKSYSPDLIVYPYLSVKSASKITPIIQKMDTIVIGPGLGRDPEALTLAEEIIKTCKSLNKPIIIDAAGLDAVSQNPSIIKDYPAPGVIITPNHKEVILLKNALARNDSLWFQFWGNNVSVLMKGKADQFCSSVPNYEWSLTGIGSGRRVGGQGDILSGSMGTLFSWSIKSYTNCDNTHQVQLTHSIAAYAASKITRTSNVKAFTKFGRSLLATDMLAQIHAAFEYTFFNS